MSLAGEALRKREQNLKVPIHKAPKHSELPYSGVASTVPDNQGFLNSANDQKKTVRSCNFTVSYVDYSELDLGKYLTSEIWLLNATAIVNINNPVTEVVATSHLRQSCAVGLVISS